MGPGWIEVGADTIGEDAPLTAWLEAAMEHNHAVTGGPSRRSPGSASGSRRRR